MWLSDPDSGHAVRHAELNEIQAWRDLVAAAPADWAREHGLHAHELPGPWPGLALVCPALPYPLFNRVLGLGLDADLNRSTTSRDADTDTHADAAGLPGAPADPFGLLRLPTLYAGLPSGSWVVQPTPGAPADFVSDRLQALGWRRRDPRWVKTGAWLTPGYTARLSQQLAAQRARVGCGIQVQVVGADQAADFVAPIVDGMGLPAWMADWIGALCGRPGWRTYVASRVAPGRPADARPVAAAALYCADGRGWLGMATTVPTARGAGLQRLLMLQRLVDARALGAHFVSLETGEPSDGEPGTSYHNMLGCGLRPLAWRTNWVRPTAYLPDQGR